MVTWRVVSVDRTESTNADVCQAALDGAAEGLVVDALFQSDGRGRLDRRWISAPEDGLTMSVLLRPDRVPTRRWTWLPLLVGCAVLNAVRTVVDEAGVASPSRSEPLPELGLKWPNDVLLGGRKFGGILTERVDTTDGPAAVVGIGLNLATPADRLPVPTATSLVAAGYPVIDRQRLRSELLAELDTGYAAWYAASGDPDVSGLHRAYSVRCTTLGRTVRVEGLGASDATGDALRIDPDGRLVVASGGVERTFGAGDVVHATVEAGE